MCYVCTWASKSQNNDDTMIIDDAWNVHDFIFVKVVLAMKFVKCLSNENHQLYSNIFESVAIQE